MYNMYELECATKGLAKLSIIARCTKIISWIACQVILGGGGWIFLISIVQYVLMGSWNLVDFSGN